MILNLRVAALRRYAIGPRNFCPLGLLCRAHPDAERLCEMGVEVSEHVFAVRNKEYRSCRCERSLKQTFALW
jgi:hypothetical protein